MKNIRNYAVIDIGFILSLIFLFIRTMEWVDWPWWVVPLPLVLPIFTVLLSILWIWLRVDVEELVDKDIEKAKNKQEQNKVWKL
jgi:hypothetical protein